MFASPAVAQPPVQQTLFDVVEEQLDDRGLPQLATYVDGPVGVVTLQASTGLLSRGFPIAIEELAGQTATDFACRVARKLGMHDPCPQLCDAPYAVDSEGKVCLAGEKIAAYRVEIRLNVGSR